MEIDKILAEKELNVEFQPIVSLENGDIIGYEALCKIAEKSVSDYFDSLDMDSKKRLEKQCRKTILKTNAMLRNHKKLFININPDLLSDEEFNGDYTKRKIEKYQNSINSIILEVSEKCCNAEEELLSIVNHYKSLDFRICLDNTGSAYSGLGRICALNPDFIKIDKKIIHEIQNDEIRQSMIKSLVTFCKESGIILIAVGIETSQELDVILKLGISFAQGFYFSRPALMLPKVSAESYSRIINFRKNQSSLENPKKETKDKKQKDKKKESTLTFDGITSGRPIGELCTRGVTVFPDMPVTELLHFFHSNEECSIVTVVDLNHKILGVIPRNTLLDALGGQYGYGLNYKKLVKDLMLQEFITLDYNEFVETAAAKATSRPEKNIYDPMIISKEDAYFGIVTVKELLDSIVTVEVSERTREINRKNRLLQEQQRVQKLDMHMAELVQKSFYPVSAPCRDNWDCAFYFNPMSSVSGDLYDFYYDRDGRFCGTGLFDVSGHGVASGLVGILSKYLAEKIFMGGLDKKLNKVIEEFNKTLTAEKGMVENYLTGIFLRVKDSLVEYVSAGHCDVLVKSYGADTCKTGILGDKDGSFRGRFLGIPGLDGEKFETVKANVKKDTYLLLFTDCLIESRNLAGDEMGIDLLQKVFKKAPKGKAKEVLDYVLDSFNAYTEAVPLRDDLTVIVMHYVGV